MKSGCACASSSICESYEEIALRTSRKILTSVNAAEDEAVITAAS